MSDPLRDERAAKGMEIARWLSRKFPRMPAGCTVDDLESVGGEAVVEALALYDPGAGTFEKFVTGTIRNRMKSFLRTAWRRGRVVTSIGGEENCTMDSRDRTADDPADVAEANEAVAVHRSTASGATRLTVDQIAGALPPPDIVAARVAQLRAALFGSITAADVGDIMVSVMDKAKAGDLRAAKVVIDLIAPKNATTATATANVAILSGRQEGV